MFQNLNDNVEVSLRTLWKLQISSPSATLSLSSGMTLWRLRDGIIVAVWHIKRLQNDCRSEGPRRYCILVYLTLFHNLGRFHTVTFATVSTDLYTDRLKARPIEMAMKRVTLFLKL